LTERIHIFPRFEVSVCHDLFICVWFDCHNASTCDMTRSDPYPAIATIPFKSVRLRPRGRDSKRKSQLAEFTICLVINSVISLHLLLRKDKALRHEFPYCRHCPYMFRVRKLQFLVQKLQCHGNDLFDEHGLAFHMLRATCPISFAAGIQGHSGT